jgi:hypothetical protein
MIIKATFENPEDEDQQVAMQFELPHHDYLGAETHSIAWAFACSLSSWKLIEIERA